MPSSRKSPHPPYRSNPHSRDTEPITGHSERLDRPPASRAFVKIKNAAGAGPELTGETSMFRKMVFGAVSVLAMATSMAHAADMKE
ncbi:MAG: hypothetical protein E5W63_19295, partial [Mesorhizobium sp.]